MVIILDLCGFESRLIHYRWKWCRSHARTYSCTYAWFIQHNTFKWILKNICDIGLKFVHISTLLLNVKLLLKQLFFPLKIWDCRMRNPFKQINFTDLLTKADRALHFFQHELIQPCKGKNREWTQNLSARFTNSFAPSWSFIICFPSKNSEKERESRFGKPQLENLNYENFGLENRN